MGEKGKQNDKNSKRKRWREKRKENINETKMSLVIDPLSVFFHAKISMASKFFLIFFLSGGGGERQHLLT